VTQRTPDRARGDADRRRAAALATWCHAASVQDRDGAIPLLRASRRLCPSVERAFAAERIAAATLTAAIEIVRKQAGQVGFAVQLAPAGRARTRDRSEHRQCEPPVGCAGVHCALRL
jgi:hypothetical protein